MFKKRNKNTVNKKLKNKSQYWENYRIIYK